MGVLGEEDMFKDCLDSSVCQYITTTIKSETLQLAAISGYFASSPVLSLLRKLTPLRERNCPGFTSYDVGLKRPTDISREKCLNSL